jgi:triosephosphate isomerase
MDKLVIGNWKMNGRRSANRALLAALLQEPACNRSGVSVAVPAVYLADVAEQLATQALSLSAQDVSQFADDGAFTGEVSAAMLAEFATDYVLIGHSERRQYFGESNRLLGAKFDAARSVGLVPVLCVGETLAEREAGQAEAVIAAQLDVLVGRASGDLVVAYEPVWAIGTGKVATIEQIAAMHAYIKQWVLQNAKGADSIRVLYGGSVKAENADAVLSTPNVDGALVGGASLDASAFRKICETAEKLIKYGNSQDANLGC